MASVTSVGVERAAGDLVLESRAFQALHGDEGAALMFADVVDGANVGMIQGRSRLRFAAETTESLRVLCEFFGKKFQSYGSAEASVFGFVDDAHAATAELFDDTVVGNRRTKKRVCVCHAGAILDGGCEASQ